MNAIFTGSTLILGGREMQTKLNTMVFSSKLIEQAVGAFAGLPGIGRKTALRLTLYLVNKDAAVAENFARVILQLRREIRHCQVCHNLSDMPTCQICLDPRRDQTAICVVESIRDVMAIEDTGQYRGTYHVLGGLINPMEGIGPDELAIDSLLHRVSEGKVAEVILAISPTIEGDTTMFYLSRKLKETGIRISAIARGVSFGGELEYADEVTLGRSIVARLPYHTGPDR